MIFNWTYAFLSFSVYAFTLNNFYKIESVTLVTLLDSHTFQNGFIPFKNKMSDCIEFLICNLKLFPVFEALTPRIQFTRSTIWPGFYSGFLKNK